MVLTKSTSTSASKRDFFVKNISTMQKYAEVFKSKFELVKYRENSNIFKYKVKFDLYEEVNI